MQVKSKIAKTAKKDVNINRKDKVAEVKESNKIETKSDKEIKQNRDNFIDQANCHLEKSVESFNKHSKDSQKALSKFSDVFNKSFNNQYQFFNDALACKNASDCIELYKNLFKNNYEAYMSLMNEWFHTLNQVQNVPLKDWQNNMDFNLRHMSLKD